MRLDSATMLVLATAAVACNRGGGTEAPSPAPPPVRSAQHAAAVSAKTFVELEDWTWARVLPDGGALLNVRAEGRLFRFDSTLSVATVALDSTLVTRPSFAFNCLRPFTGDSSVFITPNSADAGARAPLEDPGWKFRILDAQGRIARSIMLPSNYWPNCFATAVGPVSAAIFFSSPRPSNQGDGLRIDTLPIVRLDLSSGRRDTVAWIESDSYGTSRDIDSVGANGRRYLESMRPAFTRADAWAVTSDGALAVIRSRDYEVDWMLADGSRRVTRNISWASRRLSLQDKQHIVDSVAPIKARQAAEATRQMWEQKRGDFVMMTKMAPPADLPDYVPPFVGDHWYTRTDDMGNIWVRSIPTTPIGLGTLYDVIDRNGRMVDRVLFAPGRTLLGVAGGNAYLSAGALGAMRLERVVINRDR